MHVNALTQVWTNRFSNILSIHKISAGCYLLIVSNLNLLSAFSYGTAFRNSLSFRNRTMTHILTYNIQIW